MNKMQLTYTAETVEQIEKDKDGGILSLIVGDFSFTNLVNLVSRGLAQGKDKAREAIMEEIKAGKDAFDIQLDIIKQLEDEGFLSRRLKMSQQIEQGILLGQDQIVRSLANGENKK